MLDLDAEDVLCLTEILHVKLALEAVLDMLDELEVVPDDRLVVDVEADDADEVAMDEDEDAGIGTRLGEAEAGENGADLLVPLSTALFESIEHFAKVTDPVLLAGNSIALWLLHVDLLFEVTIGEGCGGVELVDVPVIVGSKSEEDAE
jgi:hypothetical protein